MPEQTERTLIIVPAWNEAGNVGNTIREILTEITGLDVVVVDDGSTDETARIAAEAGARVLSLPFNMGVGGAMRTGFTYAQRHGYDRAIQVDADGSTILATSFECWRDSTAPTSRSALGSPIPATTRSGARAGGR